MSNHRSARGPFAAVIFLSLALVVPVGLAGRFSAIQRGDRAPEDASLFSDFNNDGFADLAVGVYGEDLGAAVDTGAVNVIYGSANGLQTTSPADQFWHQDSPNLNDEGETPETNDSFGHTLATGDFNGDTYADLAIGVEFESVGQTTEAGSLQVLYGSANGLQATSPDDQYLYQGKVIGGQAIDESPEDFDRFTRGLVAGHFNNDSFDDVAIGAPGETLSAADFAGVLHIMYGSSSGLQTSSPADLLIHQNRPVEMPDSPEQGDGFATALGTGDFDNNGYEDLAIGVYEEDLDTLGDAGMIHVLYSTSTGVQVTNPPNDLFHQDSPSVEDLAEPSDEFGRDLFGGKFNGDLYFDLAIGARKEDIGTNQNAGAAHVFYGSSSGLDVSGPPGAPDDQFLFQGKVLGGEAIDDSAEPFEEFGRALAAADFNSDGFWDLVISAPGEDVDGDNQAGAVHVLLGSSTFGITAVGEQFWYQDLPEILDESEPEDEFGKGLVAADFNGDDSIDLAIGIWQEDISAGNAVGAAQVLYGSADGIPDDPDDQFVRQGLFGIDGTAEAGDRFGFAVR